MGVVGLGTAVVECARVRLLIEKHGEAFLGRVFTPREVAACHASRLATEQFAARWAVKEAVARCLGPARKRDWTELEVGSRGGRTVVKCRGAAKAELRAAGGRLLASFAFCRTHATATAILVAKEAPAA